MPDFDIEAEIHAGGLHLVCGVDEAGRGPLAGPVVAAAVILDPKRIPEGLNDSKKLSERRRLVLFEQVMVSAQVCVAAASAAEVDALNIRGATLAAMVRAVGGLPRQPQAALIDGRDVPAPISRIGRAIVGGDRRSLSIAAASIVAKVMRDRMCAFMHHAYPQYGFDGHKGYPTAAHRKALETHGPCAIHRHSYAPVRDALNTRV